jgi:hypothetical protein
MAEENEEIQVNENEEQVTEQPQQDVDITPEEEAKLPFPVSTVVRLMRQHMSDDKMIRKEVKIAMNKWLGNLCATVSREMNKFPYVMMGLNEFKEGTKVFESLEAFYKEKERILAHLEAIKRDIEKLEWDLGKRNSILEGDGSL